MKRGINTLFLPPLIVTLIFMAMGVFLLVFPGFFVRILPPLLGIVLILVGLQGIVSGLSLRGFLPHPGFTMARGALAIVVAIIFLVKNDLSLVFISILFGLFVLISAVLGIADAVRKRRLGEPWLFAIVEGVIDILLGLLLLVAPFRGMNLWTQILGIHFILVGIGALLALLRVKKQLLLMLPDDSGENGE